MRNYYFFSCFKRFPSNFTVILKLLKQFISGLRLLVDIAGSLILTSKNLFDLRAATLIVSVTF